MAVEEVGGSLMKKPQVVMQGSSVNEEAVNLQCRKMAWWGLGTGELKAAWHPGTPFELSIPFSSYFLNFFQSLTGKTVILAHFIM